MTEIENVIAMVFAHCRHSPLVRVHPPASSLPTCLWSRKSRKKMAEKHGAERRAGERERGTQNNSVATKAKKTGTTDRHRRPVDRSKRVKKRTRRFLGGKQRERGDDVSQPPVGPLLSRLSMVTFCRRRRLRPFLCKSLCYATINKGRRGGWRGHLSAGHVGAGMDKSEEQGERVGAAAPL